MSPILRVFFTTAVSHKFSCANYSCSASLRTSHPQPPRVLYLAATLPDCHVFCVVITIIKGADFLYLACSIQKTIGNHVGVSARDVIL